MNLNENLKIWFEKELEPKGWVELFSEIDRMLFKNQIETQLWTSYTCIRTSSMAWHNVKDLCCCAFMYLCWIILHTIWYIKRGSENVKKERTKQTPDLRI